jgi:D-threo-aldose 1-dehydrogenase
MTRVGFVGVGVMGAPLARNILKGGFLLAVYDVDAAATALPELLPYCARTGVGVLLASPFYSGILATGSRPEESYFYQPASPQILARTRRLEAVCQRHNVPFAAAALQFPLDHAGVASVVGGARSRAEVEANVRLLRQPIPRGFWQEVKAEDLLPAAAPVP